MDLEQRVTRSRALSSQSNPSSPVGLENTPNDKQKKKHSARKRRRKSQEILKTLQEESTEEEVTYNNMSQGQLSVDHRHRACV